MGEHSFSLCGGTVLVDIPDDGANREQFIVRSLEREGLRLQSIFNFFDDHSEISRLNQCRQARVSPELLEVLSCALSLCAITDGKYDISQGRRFLARKKGVELPSITCSFKDITVDGDVVTLLDDDVLIDLGSIAKGFIVDRLVELLQDMGVSRGFIDARGDMRVFGCAEAVEIQHPRDESKTLRPFLLKDEAVATSGDYLQFDREFGQSHILGQQRFASVTVIADNAMRADGLATCVFVLGEDHVDRVLSHFSEAKIIGVRQDLGVVEFEGVCYGK